MDNLINILESCSLNLKTVDLDNLLDKLDLGSEYDTESECESESDEYLEDLSDPDFNWERINKNINSMRYIKQLIDTYDFPETIKFKNILNKILYNIDKQNKSYLFYLNWEDKHIYYPECCEIKKLLEQSLKINNPFEKLNVIVEAYNKFVPIIEFYRKEKCIEGLHDENLIDDIEQLKKKRKLN